MKFLSPREIRKLLPKQTKNLSFLEYEKGIELVATGKALYAGHYSDGNVVELELKKYGLNVRDVSFANITACRTVNKLFFWNGITWASTIIKEELNLLFEMEKTGKILVFFVSSHTLQKNIFVDHVYKDHDQKVAFGFSAWEIKYLLPMFPNTCKIACMRDR